MGHKIKNIFFAQGLLRPGWRMLAFFLVAFGALHFLTLLLWEEILIRYILSFWLLLGLSFLFVRYVDKRPLGTIGFMFHSCWFKEYALGTGMGFIAVALIFAFFLLMGFVDVQWSEFSINLVKNLFFLHLITTLFQTAFEELLFRGYLFQNLIKATNPLAATIILSGLFGAGHLLTPHASWITALNLTALGVLFAVAYLKTRSLWLPSALHFAWNYFMRNIFSLPVSGTKTVNSLLQVEVSGPNWLTGGEYGPEAGVPALLVMIALILFIIFWRGIRPNPELERLWERDKPIHK